MVFGIATSVASLHQTLPYQVSSLLALHTFNAPVSSDYLSLVLERVRCYLILLIVEIQLFRSLGENSNIHKVNVIQNYLEVGKESYNLRYKQSLVVSFDKFISKFRN